MLTMPCTRRSHRLEDACTCWRCWPSSGYRSGLWSARSGCSTWNSVCWGTRHRATAWTRSNPCRRRGVQRDDHRGCPSLDGCPTRSPRLCRFCCRLCRDASVPRVAMLAARRSAVINSAPGRRGVCREAFALPPSRWRPPPALAWPRDAPAGAAIRSSRCCAAPDFASVASANPSTTIGCCARLGRCTGCPGSVTPPPPP